jgi:hypothetical protein
MHICQAHVSTTESKSAPRVLDSQQVEHRRMQVVHFQFPLNNMVAEFVGLSINRARP